MLIIEHREEGDKEHIVPYEDMDSYIKTTLEPGIYFTIKARHLTDSDLTYKAPPKILKE